jgi:hypothetical protein
MASREFDRKMSYICRGNRGIAPNGFLSFTILIHVNFAHLLSIVLWEYSRHVDRHQVPTNGGRVYCGSETAKSLRVRIRGFSRGWVGIGSPPPPSICVYVELRVECATSFIIGSLFSITVLEIWAHSFGQFKKHALLKACTQSPCFSYPGLARAFITVGSADL